MHGPKNNYHFILTDLCLFALIRCCPYCCTIFFNLIDANEMPFSLTSAVADVTQKKCSTSWRHICPSLSHVLHLFTRYNVDFKFLDPFLVLSGSSCNRQSSFIFLFVNSTNFRLFLFFCVASAFDIFLIFYENFSFLMYFIVALFRRM